MWFQSTHPRRVWLEQLTLSPTLYGFNPHTHEGCDIWSLSRSLGCLSFNPHTHEGCDSFLFLIQHFIDVSIHTPTKGVTPFNPQGCLKPWTFQSTHPRRVWRHINFHTFVSKASFNPHTHEGCDSANIVILVWVFVSIHTPTKGVTLLSGIRTSSAWCFNPHTHEGCDCIILFVNACQCSFNPHTHEGCDLPIW